MKVSELIEWLKTLEQDYEVCVVDKYSAPDELSHIEEDKQEQRYTLI